MEFFNSLNLTQIKGGTKLKQGDLGSVLSYSLTDENGQEITSFDNKTAYINLVLDDKIWFTTTTLVDISRVTFRIDKAIPTGLYYLEIKIDDYIFPSDRDSIILIEEGSTPYDLKELVPNYDINMTLKGILSDLSQKGIDISDLKTKMNAIYDNALADHAEIIQARGGLPSLDARLDGLDLKDADLQSQINTNKTNINTTSSRIDNLIVNAGNGTVPSELTDLRVGYDGKTYPTAGDALRKQLLNISVLSQEYTVYFGFSTAPKFNRNGSILEIAMPENTRLFAIDKNGKIQATIYAAGSTTDSSLSTFDLTYNLEHNQALILNIDAGKVIIVGITDARNYKHVVLAYNYQGVLAAGDFIKYDARNIVLPKSYTVFFANGKKPKITEKSHVIIDMPTDSNAVLYAVDNTGKEVGKLQPSGGNAQYQSQYVLVHGQSLIWKIATNELVVQHINDARTQTDIVLAYNHAGYLSAGEFERYKVSEIETVNIDNFKYSNYDFVLRQGQLDGYPENSITGLLHGKSKGYNHARMSVKFTSDGHAILSHDDYLNYKIKNIDGTDTDPSVAISSLTLEELQNNYDFGWYYGDKFKGTKVSTLDELMTAASYNGIKLDLELKDSVYTDAMVDYIVERLVLNGLIDSTLISSGELAVLDKFSAKCPALSFGYICNPNNTRVDEILGYRHLNNQLRLDIFDTSTLTVPVALYAKSNGVKIKVGSCYSVADIRKWIALGTDVIEVAYIANPISTLANYYNVE